jgi:hypothetical protein
VNRSTIWVIVSIGLAIGACAKKAENVAAAYVSPLAYERFSCRQLAEEAGRVSQRAGELSGVQDRKRTGERCYDCAIIVFCCCISVSGTMLRLPNWRG